MRPQGRQHGTFIARRLSQSTRASAGVKADTSHRRIEALCQVSCSGNDPATTRPHPSISQLSPPWRWLTTVSTFSNLAPLQVAVASHPRAKPLVSTSHSTAGRTVYGAFTYMEPLASANAIRVGTITATTIMFSRVLTLSLSFSLSVKACARASFPFNETSTWCRRRASCLLRARLFFLLYPSRSKGQPTLFLTANADNCTTRRIARKCLVFPSLKALTRANGSLSHFLVVQFLCEKRHLRSERVGSYSELSRLCSTG